MAIQSSEIKTYKATINNDTSANGGRMSSNLVVSNIRNAVFPNVSETERTDGNTRWRKIFFKIANDDDLTFNNVLVHMTNTTGADDNKSMCAGTQTNIYSDLSSPRMYGCGTLNADVIATDTEIEVQIEDTALSIFNTSSADNIIWISNGTTTEYFENVAASKTDDVYTLTLNTGDTLGNDYNTSNTYIASCINAGDVECEFDSVVVTSTAGTFDDSSFPILLDNIGTVYDSWTLEFTSATAYSITGANEGLLASGGNIGSNTSPINSDFAKKYFTISSGAFGGTFAIGDTITFKTYPAAIPIWIKEVVPAGTASYSGNIVGIRVNGESA